MVPLLGINPANLLLLPLHVVLLELVIDLTCSIVLERQPAENDIMERAPRNPKEKLLTTRILFKSIIQVLVILGTSFGIYFIFLNHNQNNIPIARSMGLTNKANKIYIKNKENIILKSGYFEPPPVR